MSAVVRRHFAVLEDPFGRICGAKCFRSFSDLCFDTFLIVRSLVTDLPVGPVFLVLGSILPVVVCPGVLLSCEHHYAHKEKERFIVIFLAGWPRLFLCILKHINIHRDPLYFNMIALHFIMQRQEVKVMTTRASCL